MIEDHHDNGDGGRSGNGDDNGEYTDRDSIIIRLSKTICSPRST